MIDHLTSVDTVLYLQTILSREKVDRLPIEPTQVSDLLRRVVYKLPFILQQPSLGRTDVRSGYKKYASAVKEANRFGNISIEVKQVLDDKTHRYDIKLLIKLMLQEVAYYDPIFEGGDGVVFGARVDVNTSQVRQFHRRVYQAKSIQ